MLYYKNLLIYRKIFQYSGGHFDLESKNSEIEKTKELLKEEGIWDDVEKATSLNRTLASLEKSVSDYNHLLREIKDNIELLELIEEEEDLKEVENAYEKLKTQYGELEVASLLNGEYDAKSCYLEIHPGAGGTEACDWAGMLYRMYAMFCEKNGYTYKVIDEQKGDEAGLKSITILIDGYYPYGYFKGETGVHRLVRISPFDSNARRHTSFASVGVVPAIDDSIEIDIKESDLKVDVYHSSGAGGQSVNTSNSAVRITHLPTKTVVTCQIERSQNRNKDIAMQMLKSKLYAMEKAKKDKEKSDLKGDIVDINFGSQIRNYVLEPYKLIKDVRTNYETSNVSKVLDGDLLPFMESYLKNKRGN